ncbi:alkaline phosphatase family protein [Aurantimonas sp. MSK8Z-1]|uniref:alkaline phosphatase family protein n=1 Tax=Mangrovibrevibacter kandeliae TaxID=2968473 RepID=UPI002118D5A6|nr:alkaline phosphatase family protein [Aurantimonas sp. MSK8Z-1]MCW4115480.1 alkaline phosphatase family protein [Aurantimonas sp. MSK8Z-1]
MTREPGSTLIVCFDGLRRDRVTADRMPNLARFMAAGVDMLNSRSVFPSETRVASTSTVTGSSPGEHGLVANQFINRQVVPEGLFNTADHDHLAKADAAGILIDRDSLGQRLARAGKRFAVVSTATAGATAMMSYGARPAGQPVFSVHPGVGTPELMREAEARFGPVPPAATPNTARLDHATRVLTDLVYPDHRPDLAIFWMSDPDITSHGFGLDAPETITAQRGADAAFGRILEWQAGGEGPQNIMVMSDHGQITGAARIDLRAALPEHAAWLSPGYFSGLYLPDPTRERIAAAVERLTREPWCGLVFVSLPGEPGGSVPGALPAAVMGGGHSRSAPVSFTLRAAPPSDPGGLETCLFAGGIAPGGGMHGGVTRGELSTVLAAAGPAFRAGLRSEIPCWLPDIAPTVLSVLGLPTTGMSGRVLRETLAGVAEAPPVVERRSLEARLGEHRQGVEQWLVEGRAITDHGWSTGPGTMPA